MFQVLENDKPAEHSSFPEEVHPSWNCSTFNTFEEAKLYVVEWFFPVTDKEMAYNIAQKIEMKIGVNMNFGDLADPFYMKIIEV